MSGGYLNVGQADGRVLLLPSLCLFGLLEGIPLGQFGHDIRPLVGGQRELNGFGAGGFLDVLDCWF
jgi:hypothetical protein